MKPKPVKSAENLAGRVVDFFSADARARNKKQIDLDFSAPETDRPTFPSSNVKEFLDFASSSMPTSAVYLFGGVLRDLALYGKRGPKSDIDIVVDGDWRVISEYVKDLGAEENKFGGLRLEIDKWPIDLWQAENTWAFVHNKRKYSGISSLLDTTVLNWDAVLFNWRDKRVLTKADYYKDLSELAIDLVLESNPNPRGMAVRVFRHLWLKDAKKVSQRVALYLSKVAKEYDQGELSAYELKSYGDSYLQPQMYEFFKRVDCTVSPKALHYQFGVLSEVMEREFEFGTSECTKSALNEKEIKNSALL